AAFYRFKLGIKNIGVNDLATLLQIRPSALSFTGSADLALQVEGIPREGVRFGLSLTGDNLDLTSSLPSPLSIAETELSGRIQYDKTGVDLEEFRLRVETDRGRLETGNQSRFTLTENGVSGISSNGTLSATIFPAGGQTEPPFFARNLTASYKTDLIRTKTGWNATNGELHLPGLELLFDGQWKGNSRNAFDLNLAIPETSFTPAIELLPGLSKLKDLGLSGSFSSRISLKRSSAGTFQTAGRLNLTDVHLGIPGPLADLSRLNGSIELQNTAIMGKGLKALLGRSPISVDLSIPDISAPDTTLHVLADSIRADELIFTSDKRYLKQVDGIVRIAGSGVTLGPIHVKMDGGTDATVNGTVRNFAAPDVALQIVGRHGNIDEIIGLWEHPSVTKIAETLPHPPRRGSLLIDIVTDSGQISGMQFDRATSQITQRNDTLVIGPIRFKAGAGEGLGQVLIVRSKEGPSRLKISGNI
ncbi:MAG TPA: DUF3971 domain-containing protein, partial [Candidatus Krumholzibacterium sp.]|nr:DUF3971 domain-containing protein [Candidatus Krumholzibacterium sp.]